MSASAALSDRELFGQAVWQARNASRWRALAASGGDERHTPRQALHQALRAERCVLNLSITAEQRCLRAMDMQEVAA